ncbi:hypothetical protein [Deferribacter abyssi]|uniref:hypothetical protein n=1 Tax=Deferribacter abyssi TaxID=213806 RepID=UPI003C20390A
MKNKQIDEVKEIVLKKVKLPELVIYEWGEGIPKNRNLYCDIDESKCWYIVYNFKCNNAILESAKLLILDKNSNKVLYDDSLLDEG